MEILLFLVVIGLSAAIFVLVQKINSSKDDKSITILQNQINALSQMQNEKLDRTLKELNDRLNEQKQTINSSLTQQFQLSQKSIKEYSENIKTVTEELTKLAETNSQIKSFAGQLQSLENILKNPKQRGILGEYFLETLLKNVLPPKTYQMQYKFKNGDIVDAVIFVKEKIIPIDSKFSLENYNRIIECKEKTERENLERIFKQDLKNRIDETSKYIRPNEGTMQFAFMFIPSEGIYYDLLINQVGAVKTNTHDLIEYAFKKKGVIITSPTSFLAYLQTVLQGLNALKIEESALQIRENVIKLSMHLNAFEANMNKLGKNLSTVVTAYNDARVEYKKIDKDVVKITGQTLTISSDEVEKPSLGIE